ncbi:pirin family protein [Brevundimonas intermedia]|uniref:Pirin family protein n=1 Tax=Brevundimonas intermedia TaxID=74315 RepID=A0A4Y9RYP5_9CAUL|nr:pirin family protein [Brevundimonas intermedia]TFW14184.1 pirin family protein [Brevundimonas intermedia]
MSATHSIAVETASAHALDLPQPARKIVHRTRGKRHGPITRLMSPSDLGEIVKPFVFLDLAEADSLGGGFKAHPHSGIATHTTLLKGATGYADSTGESGTLAEGSVEWMRAGAGVWHTGLPTENSPLLGYQLWLALPAELELTPPESRYLGAEMIQAVGPARILLGQYQDRTSPIELPMSLTYLHVRLSDGERWTYHPGSDHDVAWLALNSGRVHVDGAILEREMAVFEDGAAPIDIVAEGSVELVIASAARHPHPIVLGYYSVHTSEAALAVGEANIADLGRTPEVAALRAMD